MQSLNYNYLTFVRPIYNVAELYIFEGVKPPTYVSRTTQTSGGVLVKYQIRFNMINIRNKILHKNKIKIY